MPCPECSSDVVIDELRAKLAAKDEALTSVIDAAKLLIVFVGHASYCPGTSPDCCITARLRQALINKIKEVTS